jgi:hypothetical protein
MATSSFHGIKKQWSMIEKSLKHMSTERPGKPFALNYLKNI